MILAALIPGRPAVALESLEFVAEHLPEAAMDNRFALLPLWSDGKKPVGAWSFSAQGALTEIGSGNLTLDGPMLAIAAQKSWNERTSIHVFGFLDDLGFSAVDDRRPLATVFTDTPLALPAQARFTDLGGSCRNTGVGAAVGLHRNRGWLGAHQWTFGLLYQRVELANYRANYEVLEGASTGASGFVDYSADYGHATPFGGVALPRRVGSWRLSPHALVAVPLPRRGVQGRISGPGFDLTGDTETAGRGKHFGDPSVTLGLEATYEPWGLTLDLGALGSQALLEGFIHKGIDRNWLLSVAKRF